MKTINLWQLMILTALTFTPLAAQDTSAENLIEEGAKLLDDPQLKDMFRQIRENPEEAANNAIREIKANSNRADDAVREATRVFQDNQKEIEGAAQAIQENRSSIEATANSAVEEFSRMAPTAAQTAVPTAAPTGSEAPATRPAGSVGTPLAAQPSSPDAAAFPKQAAMVVDQPIFQNNHVTPIATAPTTSSSIPDSPFLNPRDLPEPTPLAPIYQVDDEGAFESNARDEVIITAGDSEMDNNAGIITLTENVVINHPEFILECDKLVVTLAEGTSADAGEGGNSSSFKRAIATGGTVKIRRVSPDGNTQIAISRMAAYNGITKDIVLSGGPPYIQDGEKHVRCTEPDAQIVMTGDGKYKINGSDSRAPSRHKISFPVEGEDGSKTIGIGNSVGGSIDRLR